MLILDGIKMVNKKLFSHRKRYFYNKLLVNDRNKTKPKRTCKDLTKTLFQFCQWLITKGLPTSS